MTASTADEDATSPLERLLQDMVTNYQEMNPPYVEEVHAVPSELEFANAVKRNRPVVYRGLGKRKRIPALEKWTSAYLIEKMGDQQLRVAATPSGNADALVGELFVEPEFLDRSMTMAELLSRLSDVERLQSEPVLYLQSQNDNLESELPQLKEDATRSFDFAASVFESQPEVANVWIGDERSVTSLHKDPYENMYLVIHGTKTFELLPPTEFYCLHERIYKTGRYKSTPSGWTIEPHDAEIPWIPVDPSNPDYELHPRFKYAKPLSVTLERGDVLYLPALWFHKVSQTASRDPEAPLAVAVNWWYDLDYSSPLYSLSRLVRKLTLQLDGRTEED